MIAQADFVTKVGRILQTISRDFDFDTFSKHWFPTAHKTSINPECLRVVPPALEQKFIEQNLSEDHTLCTEHNPWGTMELVENTHGLMNTQACRRDNGPCQEHAQTDDYSSLQKISGPVSKTCTN